VFLSSLSSFLSFFLYLLNKTNAEAVGWTSQSSRLNGGGAAVLSNHWATTLPSSSF
jgi:hypothetical protein